MKREAFVVRNQLGQYWGRKRRWVDGADPAKVLACPHRDEALNILVELSAEDIDLRGAVAPVAIGERGIPEVEPSEHLIPEDEDGEPEA